MVYELGPVRRRRPTTSSPLKSEESKEIEIKPKTTARRKTLPATRRISVPAKASDRSDQVIAPSVNRFRVRTKATLTASGNSSAIALSSKDKKSKDGYKV